MIDFRDKTDKVRQGVVKATQRSSLSVLAENNLFRARNLCGVEL
jgi:hypothetical protein